MATACLLGESAVVVDSYTLYTRINVSMRLKESVLTNVVVSVDFRSFHSGHPLQSVIDLLGSPPLRARTP